LSSLMGFAVASDAANGHATPQTWMQHRGVCSNMVLTRPADLRTASRKPACAVVGEHHSESLTAPSSRLPGNVAFDATPLIWAAVMNACLSVCGPTGLVIPARRATPRTIRAAPCRSTRRRSGARNSGPSHRSPMARSIARAVRGASGIVTTLPPLRRTVSVRWPRSLPRASMSAPVASDTRSPFRASSEISACSAGGPK
jgi:hypothetical protein